MARLVLGIIAILATVAACASAPATAPGRDVLWRIVTECLEPSAPGYCERCAWPVAGACHIERPCEATTELWALTREFVALRDIKMCGCPVGFVHGLALPRFRVTGVDDLRRPRGIWQFAWDVARRTIADDSAIVLVANAPRLRTQDQLHVHIARLRPDARHRLATRPTTRVSRLEDVWDAAGGLADASRFREYGILVVGTSDGAFLVLADPGDVEREFGESRCR
jgi:CDP-diacylglycerol pyrophosphatase